MPKRLRTTEYRIVTVVNNIALYIWKLLREKITKGVLTRKKTLYSVWWWIVIRYCGDCLTVYWIVMLLHITNMMLLAISESGTIKKPECQKIDAFELWCWRRLLRVPWTTRRSKQSILKEINPEYSLEGLILKLKLQYFNTWCEELIDLKRPWCWKKLKAKGEGVSRGWDGEIASPTQWTWIWTSCGRWWRTVKLGVLQSLGWQRVGHNWATEEH